MGLELVYKVVVVVIIPVSGISGFVEPLSESPTKEQFIKNSIQQIMLIDMKVTMRALV